MTHSEELFLEVTAKNKPAQARHLVQTGFLTDLVDNQIPVAIYLTNGIKLLGYIKSFNEYSLILANNVTSQVVYKRAISTVLPT